jgi:hypothetical protein
VGAELSNWGEVRARTRRGDGSADVLVGDPGLPRREFDLGAAFLEFAYDRLDSAYFPRHGQAFACHLARRARVAGARAATRTSCRRVADGALARPLQPGAGMDGGSALDDRSSRRSSCSRSAGS